MKYFYCLVFTTLLTLASFAGFAHADERKSPVDMEVVGTVVLDKPVKGLKNSAIVSVLHGPEDDPQIVDIIWYEGQTRKIVVGETTHTLKLIKVETVNGKGGVCTFEVRGLRGRPPRFKVAIKKSKKWGLTRK